MTLVNDSFNRIADTSTSGTLLATHTIGGKEHPVVMVADESGHLQQTLPTYAWWLPGQAAAAGKLYGDIYNSSASTYIVEVRGIWAIPKTDVANAAVLPIEVLICRTNAIGTSGTTNLYQTGTGSSQHNITPFDTGNSSGPFSGTSTVSARLVPAGGATIATLWWSQYIFPEETNAGTYLCAMTNLLPNTIMAQRLTLNAGQGLLLKQGTVASTGSMGFLSCVTVI